MRTDLESDLRLGYVHLNRPSSTSHFPLKTARARRTPVYTYFLVMVAERQCRVPVVLVAVEWFSVVVYSGLGVETRGLCGVWYGD